MMKFRNNKNYTTRKLHRYFGVFIGIQFLLWTVGGLYFSWNNMHDVHGETLLKQDKTYARSIPFNKLQKAVDSLRLISQVDSVHSVKVVEAFGEPLVQYRYFQNRDIKIQLIDVKEAKLRPPFSAQECLKLVEAQLLKPLPVEKITFYDKHTVDAHHEYRGKPLPAYGFKLDHPTETTVYVSSEFGTITSVRNNNWRRFDFLWMLHTMDYKTRDHITNGLLRFFSILGLCTILSGFYLFYLTSPTLRKLKKKKE